MKLCLLFFLVSIQAAFAQENDSLKYVIYKDEFGVKKKAPMVYANQVLLIKGDSMFFIPDEAEMRTFLDGNHPFDVFHNNDSVAAILRKHIKALVILKSDGKKKN